MRILTSLDWGLWIIHVILILKNILRENLLKRMCYLVAGPSPVLYLVDERLDFVSVRCSNTLRQLAVEELVKPQSLLIVSNVLHRQASAPIPALYAGELTVFKSSSSDPHIQERIGQLKSLDQVLLWNGKASASFPVVLFYRCNSLITWAFLFDVLEPSLLFKRC